MASHRILIVDDSPTLRELIELYISRGKGHFEYCHASDGIEAETVLQENAILGTPIDLVVLDWMMPHMTGYEFLKKIRSSNSFAKQPAVLMLTAETTPEHIQACLGLGVAKYLLKPFTESDLNQAIHSVIHGDGVKNAV